MSPAAHHVLRPPSGALRAWSGSAALRVECGGEGFARARSFTRDTLHFWSLDHRCDDTILVLNELAADAAAHAAPGTAGTTGAPAAPEIRLGFLLDPTHLLVTVSYPDDHPPVYAPAGPALAEHGRGPGIVDPCPPAGKTVRARLSTCPPI